MEWLKFEKRPCQIGTSKGFLIKKTEHRLLNEPYIIKIIPKRFYFEDKK